jgi:hypothetical protein
VYQAKRFLLTHIKVAHFSVKKLKMLCTVLTVIFFSLSLPVKAVSPCKKQPIEDLVKAVAAAYEVKSMGRLDAQKPDVGKVRIVIENSLAEDNAKDRFVIKWFSSLAQLEQWLKSREHEELPARESRPLVRCAKGVCTYNFDGGILHNHLYLKKITYGSRAGCPYLKTIYLLDGD